MSQFIYLLNALESAAQAPHPVELAYKKKRNAVLDYVADLERTIAILRKSSTPPEAPRIPEGWKLVPLEPTTEMLRVGRLASEEDTEAATHCRQRVIDTQKCYRAMLAATPSIPSPLGRS